MYDKMNDYVRQNPDRACRDCEEVDYPEETGTCRDYDDFFSRTRYTVPEGVLDENGRLFRYPIWKVERPPAFCV